MSMLPAAKASERIVICAPPSRSAAPVVLCALPETRMSPTASIARLSAETTPASVALPLLVSPSGPEVTVPVAPVVASATVLPDSAMPAPGVSPTPRLAAVTETAVPGPPAVKLPDTVTAGAVARLPSVTVAGVPPMSRSPPTVIVPEPVPEAAMATEVSATALRVPSVVSCCPSITTVTEPETASSVRAPPTARSSPPRSTTTEPLLARRATSPPVPEIEATEMLSAAAPPSTTMSGAVAENTPAAVSSPSTSTRPPVTTTSPVAESAVAVVAASRSISASPRLASIVAVPSTERVAAPLTRTLASVAVPASVTRMSSPPTVAVLVGLWPSSAKRALELPMSATVPPTSTVCRLSPTVEPESVSPSPIPAPTSRLCAVMSTMRVPLPAAKAPDTAIATGVALVPTAMSGAVAVVVPTMRRSPPMSSVPVPVPLTAMSTVPSLTATKSPPVLSVCGPSTTATSPAVALRVRLSVTGSDTPSSVTATEPEVAVRRTLPPVSERVAIVRSAGLSRSVPLLTTMSSVVAASVPETARSPGLTTSSVMPWSAERLRSPATSITGPVATAPARSITAVPVVARTVRLPETPSAGPAAMLAEVRSTSAVPEGTLTVALPPTESPALPEITTDAEVGVVASVVWTLSPPTEAGPAALGAVSRNDAAVCPVSSTAPTTSTVSSASMTTEPERARPPAMPAPTDRLSAVMATMPVPSPASNMPSTAIAIVAVLAIGAGLVPIMMAGVTAEPPRLTSPATSSTPRTDALAMGAPRWIRMLVSLTTVRSVSTSSVASPSSIATSPGAMTLRSPEIVAVPAVRVSDALPDVPAEPARSVRSPPTVAVDGPAATVTKSSETSPIGASRVKSPEIDAVPVATSKLTVTSPVVALRATSPPVLVSEAMEMPVGIGPPSTVI